MAGNLVEILIVGKNMAKEAMHEVQADGLSMKSVLAGAGAVAGEALVAVGVEAVKMASEYQLATTRLVTSAGEQQKNLKLVSDGMLNMAGQVGISAQHLAEAMYYVEAAGYHGADGLKVLQAAAQGAVAENADVTDVSKALTDVLVDYHLKATQAADVTSKMITAVAHGKVNLEDFSKAFASIVPAASAAGISFNDVGAALAEMTNHGFTAQRGAQNLAQALRSLLNPTKPMVTEFDKLGGSMTTLHNKLNGPNGLTDAMQYASQIAERAGKVGTPQYAAALKLLMGTAAGANAALATTGENASATNDTIHAMAGSTADASGKVSGFALVQHTFGQQIRQLDAGFQSLLIRIGQQLMPILSKFIDYVMQNGSPILKQLGSIAQQYVVPILTQLWQVIQNLYPVAVDIFQVFGVVGYAAFVAVADVLRNAVMPLLIGLSSFLKDNKTLVQGVVAGWLLYKTALLAFAGATKVVEIATKAAAAAQWLWNLAMDANPTFLMVTALAALGVAFYEAYQHSEGFRKFVNDAAETIGHTFLTAVQAAIPVIKQFTNIIIGSFGLILRGAADAFGWMPGIGGMLKKASQDWTNFQNNVGGVFDALQNGAGSLDRALEIATQERKLKMDITDAQSKIATAEAQLKGLPPSKQVTLLAQIGVLKGQIADAQRTINGLQGKTVVITYKGVVEGYQGPGGTYTSTNGFSYAAGGVVSAAASGGGRSGMVLVGEQGPELVKLPGGSSVTPAGGTRRMLAEAAGGGEQRIVIEFTGGDANLLRWLRETVRIKGGNVQTALGQGY